MRTKDGHGRIIWLTGLSGAGKSTLCGLLAIELGQRGWPVQTLDGDDLRKGLCSDLGFSAADRAENVRRTVHVAGLIAQTGSIVLVALITPFQSLRDMVRFHLPNILEVFVDAPLSVCERRDPKGLYKRARAGELQNFTGVDSPFEIPAAPDIVCRTDQETVQASATRILDRLFEHESMECHETEVRHRSIAVDFDGVIANYGGWRGDYVLGTARADVIEALRRLRIENWKIIVHTTRGAEIVREYLIKADIPFDEINTNSEYATGSPKPVATVYWDDRALRYSGNAMQDIERIRSFRTWNGRV